MRVPSTQVQNNFGKYLKFVEANEEIIVTRKGRDIARIVPCEEMGADGVMEGAAEYKTSGSRVTYEQFLELTENSEQRFELIDGVIYNLAAPSYKHQVAVHELHGAFYNWFKGKKCTPLTSPFDITFRKAEDNICVVQPDIVVICDPEKRDVKDRYQGIPTLAVEVLSPSTRTKDMVKKLDLYMQCGVKEYWVIDPMNETIMVYQFADNDVVNHRTYVNNADGEVRSFCFEGLQVGLRDVFA
ncbi:type II toxin-antitoxin system prevent-host-death family antitoxin [Paenibacillaceae bacterium WGS1546]|uniref:type II toxin-antitoxin system prevent-host-death family antitoxin n=1 Tax=Cohnella sp. WGS1546 TaxID=3366810 RepID=UPI00372D1646